MIHLQQFNLLGSTEMKFFIYEIKHGHKSQIALLCLVSLEDYGRGRIKGHEQTLSSKVENLQSQMLESKNDRHPVFLLEKVNTLSSILNENRGSAKLIKEQRAIDNGWHRIFAIQDAAQVESIKAFSRSQNDLYIADGHHRLEASYRNFRDKLSDNEFFSAVILSSDEAKVTPYFKVVTRESPRPHQIISRLESIFERVEEASYQPTRHIAAVLPQNGIRYYKARPDRENVSQEWILDKICAVTNLDDRRQINYISGESGLENLAQSLAQNSIGFAFPCPTVREIIAFAERGEVVPPHTTCFLQKPLSDFVTRERTLDKKGTINRIFSKSSGTEIDGPLLLNSKLSRVGFSG